MIKKVLKIGLFIFILALVVIYIKYCTGELHAIDVMPKVVGSASTDSVRINFGTIDTTYYPAVLNADSLIILIYPPDNAAPESLADGGTGVFNLTVGYYQYHRRGSNAAGDLGIYTVCVIAWRGGAKRGIGTCSYMVTGAGTYHYGVQDSTRDYVDTEVAAIKTKTDQLSFTTRGLEVAVQELDEDSAIIDLSETTVGYVTTATLNPAQSAQLVGIKVKTDKLTFNAQDSLIIDYTNIPMVSLPDSYTIDISDAWGLRTGLSTFDYTSDKVTLVDSSAEDISYTKNHPDDFKATIPDSTRLYYADKQIVAHVVYETLYVHRDDFKGGTADSVYLYDSEFFVIAHVVYETLYVHRDDFKGGSADSVYLYDAEYPEIAHVVYETSYVHKEDFHSSVVKIDGGAVGQCTTLVNPTKINGGYIGECTTVVNAVYVDSLEDSLITERKIKHYTFSNAQLQGSMLSGAKIANGSFIADKFGANFLTKEKISTQAIGYDEMHVSWRDTIKSWIDNRPAIGDTAQRNASTFNASSDYVKISEGTGTGQLVLNLGMVKVSEILDGAIAYADFNANYWAGNIGINWNDITYDTATHNFSNTRIGHVDSTDTIIKPPQSIAFIDSVDTLLSSVSAVTCAGWGAYTVTLYLLDDSDSSGISGVKINIYDSAGGDWQAGHTTQANGTRQFSLDASTYTIHLQDPPNSITSPEYMTISADTTDTFWVTVFDPGSPPTGDKCRVWCLVSDLTGDWLSGCRLSIWIPDRYYPVTLDTTVVSPYTVSGVSNDTGFVFVDVYESGELTAGNAQTVKVYIELRAPNGDLIARTFVEIPDADDWEIVW